MGKLDEHFAARGVSHAASGEHPHALTMNSHDIKSLFMAVGVVLVLDALTLRANADDASASKLAVLRSTQDIHDELLSKFTRIEQPTGDVAINHSGDEPFTGDCDDYYTAAFNQLYVFGYDPYAQLLAVKTTRKRHIVACVKIDGRAVCLDHNKKRTSTISDLKRLYRLAERREVLFGGGHLA